MNDDVTVKHGDNGTVYFDHKIYLFLTVPNVYLHPHSSRKDEALLKLIWGWGDDGTGRGGEEGDSNLNA